MMSDPATQSPRDWADFDRRVRRAGRPLLAALGAYNRPILVSGCQRSGTTVATRLLKLATAINYPSYSGDSELDDALVLCGDEKWCTDRRVCFQTTYLNEQFDEYWHYDHYTMVWVLREPVAVVRSMLTNWSSDALERLYRGVGQRYREGLSAPTGLFRHMPGADALEKACASYLGKLDQLTALQNTLPPDRLLIVDYTDLVANKSTAARYLCHQLGLQYSSALEGLLGPRTKRKRAHISLQNIDQTAEENCGAAYRQRARYAAKVTAA